METSKRYNSVPVKDNCALFALTPYFRWQVTMSTVKMSTVTMSKSECRKCHTHARFRTPGPI